MHRVCVYHLLIHTQLSGYLPKHTQIVWVSSIDTYTNFTSIIYRFIQKMSGYHLSIHTQIVWVTPIYAYKNDLGIIYQYIHRLSVYHLSIHTQLSG